MLCPPVYITQAGGGVLAVAHITCATPSSVKRDSPVLPTRLLPAGSLKATKQLLGVCRMASGITWVPKYAQNNILVLYKSKY